MVQDNIPDAIVLLSCSGAPEILVYEADIVHEVHRHVKHQVSLLACDVCDGVA